MGDNIHNKYRKVDPSYYIQNGQEWQGYQLQGQEKNSRNEQTYISQQDIQQYDQNYTNYQTYQKEKNKKGYSNYSNEQIQMGYNQYHQDQGSMGYYSHPAQTSMRYNPYQRENTTNYYNQNRNTMVPLYLNKDTQESKRNMQNTGLNKNNIQYYQNLMYYNGQIANRKEFKGDKSKKDMYLDINNDYFSNKKVFKHSLSFKEAATAMLSMESNKKMPQAKTKVTSRGRGGTKNMSKMSKTTQNQTETNITSKNHEQNIYTQEQETKNKLNKSNDNKYNENTETTETRYKTISRLSDIDLHKYRNRGLQQLSQFNLLSQYTQNPNQPPTPPQSNASNFLNANYTNYIPKNVKDLIPLKKLAASSGTPTARFFPPTPKALSNIRNDQTMHKMNVVEEINLENDLIKNLKKNAISTASSLMESFQQSFSNKRKRIKNCLVEDCRHVIGEQPKIDVQYTSVDINGEKQYFLNEVLSTLLPYHLFYYKEIPQVEPVQYNYRGFAEQIERLRENVKTLSKDQDLVKQQLDYSCMCEGLDVITSHYFDLQDPDDESSPFDE